MEENNFIKNYQTEYFSLLEEFFFVFTGKTVEEFSTFKDISKTIRKFFLDLMDNIKGNKQRLQYVDKLEEKLKEFYKKYQEQALEIAAELGGYKLLLSGGNAINLAQFDAIKVASLFAEVILIPDPVLPWFAEEKKNEKFKLANILKEVFAILNLKKLAELNYESPQIIIIPLIEEIYDPEKPVNPITQAKYEVLVADFFHTYVNKQICTFSAAIEFAEKNPEEFLEKANENKLFVPPGREPGLDIVTAINIFKEDIREKRSKAEADIICGMSDHQLVLEGILECLWPQIFLIENLDRFRCAPLLPIVTHSHYAELCAHCNIEKLVDSAVLSSETSMFCQSLKEHKLSIVADLSIDSFIELKKTQAFNSLQKKFTLCCGRLFRTKFYELNKASADNLAELYETVLGYENEYKAVSDKLINSIPARGIKAPDEVQIRFFPSIAPFILNRLPFGPARKLFIIKKQEIREKQINARSFVGFSAKLV
ncbi:MAG: hypothetical protein Kow0029_03740 [Candidatus Rifleibacteriota bacterium]